MRLAMQRDECVGVQRGATEQRAMWVTRKLLVVCRSDSLPVPVLARVVGAIVYDPTTEMCRTRTRPREGRRGKI